MCARMQAVQYWQEVLAIFYFFLKTSVRRLTHTLPLCVGHAHALPLSACETLTYCLYTETAVYALPLRAHARLRLGTPTPSLCATRSTRLASERHRTASAAIGSTTPDEVNVIKKPSCRLTANQ